MNVDGHPAILQPPGDIMKRQRRSFQFSIEHLEQRRLMAVDISLNDGLLSIEGTDQAEIVEVRDTQMRVGRQFVNAIEAVVKDSKGVVRYQQAFPSAHVDSIFADLLGGNDRAYNWTNLRAVMHGGSGVDELHGGLVTREPTDSTAMKAWTAWWAGKALTTSTAAATST
jgi:hypothetical protein